ncbi:MAG: hypothetical protein HZA36_01460 [Parcubacteria group bacterium]|nr:hypothetical protein [Parcubacteria group bacterium]
MDESLGIPHPNSKKVPQEGARKEKEMLPEIEELREPIKRLLEQIRPHLEGGDYQLLVSDEASGRIPALIFLKVINRVYGKKGLPKLRFIPIAGRNIKIEDRRTREMHDQKIEHIAVELTEKILSTMPEGGSRKALVVTDAINSWAAMGTITKALRKANVGFEIATIGMTERATEFKPLWESTGVTIYWDNLTETPRLYQKEKLSGVRQKEPYHEHVYSEPVGQEADESREEYLKRRGERNKSIEALSEELFEWYKKESKNPSK